MLALFAHPDDETFGPGATLARLAAQGHDVQVVCATRGESGTIDRSAHIGRRRLAALREQELVQACRALGVNPPWIFTFPDRALIRLEEETLLRPFVRAVRTFRPDVMISFHADGISGHPDHRTVTARAVSAYHEAAERDRWPDLGRPHAAQRFWAYCVPESRARLVTTRKLFAVPDAEIDVVIDAGEYMLAKRAAVEAHATQKLFVERMEKQLGNLDGFWGKESFVLAESRCPLPPGGTRPVNDLFAGMQPA